ncbi:MAG: DUF3592 domain-containing protein, partial [Roseibacillus sp.]|nr:DUF3592 domain-containing protein [Roseibacillus sp.]
WEETECTIVESRIAQRKIGSDVEMEYNSAVLYGYSYEGKAYTSERYSLRGAPWSSSETRAEWRVARFAVGTAHSCYVDPEDPSSAVLRFPLIFVAGGTGMMIGALRHEWNVRRSSGLDN